MLQRHPTKAHSFKALKDMGLPVESVVDVGILTCTSDLMEAFPDVPHFLVEPVEEFYPNIERIYRGAGLDYTLIKAAASEEDGTARLKTSSIRKEKRITHSRLSEDGGDGDNFRDVPSITVASLVKKYNVSTPFLLKIDVDGVELKVMKGARNVAADCSILCIEAGIKNFADRCNAALELGFELFDVVDLCYYGQRFVQADFVFINAKMVKGLKLDVYADGFDVEQWNPYHPESGALQGRPTLQNMSTPKDTTIKRAFGRLRRVLSDT